MKKSTKLIFSIIIIILTIALCIMTYLFIYAKNAANENLQHVLDAGEKVFELNSKIEELEEQLANTATISSVTNTTNSYNPMGVSIANKSVDNTVVEPQNYSRKPELVTLEVDTDTLSKIGVTLIITDNNETSYGWGKDYEVQKKENNNWINLEPSEPMIVQDIGYMLDENNQCKQNIDWSHYYGKLENGTYRIKKKVYDNKYIDLYSNEFEIK
jgi:hypothetical protein